MLTKMLLRGTASTSKGQLAEEIESMGGRISSDVNREMTNLNLSCFKGDLSRAVAILGDAVQSATLDHAELEIAKQEQTQTNDNMNKDLERTTLEAVHFNSFRDHMMGQPINGDADNVQNMTADVLNAYRSANYTGENIVVVGTGGVEHDAFVEQVNAAFGNIQQ
jgi:processing peptidase subunit beta